MTRGLNGAQKGGARALEKEDEIRHLQLKPVGDVVHSQVIAGLSCVIENQVMKKYLEMLAALIGSKERKAAYWRLLKAGFVAATGALLLYSRSEEVFLTWALIFAATLAFAAFVNENPFKSLVGLAFAPLGIVLLIGWFAVKKLFRLAVALSRLGIAAVFNGPFLTSLPALVTGLFLFVVATGLTVREVGGESGHWLAQWLNFWIGILLIVQLVGFCREPLSPILQIAERGEKIVSSFFEAQRVWKSSLVGLLVQASTVDRWLKSLASWSERDEIFDFFKKYRTRGFVGFWILLLGVGTFFFTNLFVLNQPPDQPGSVKTYFETFLTVLTAVSGNLLGTIPEGVFFKSLFALLCVFQVGSIVLLVLVYSISVDSDVARLRKIVGKSSTRSSNALVLGFEKLLSGAGDHEEVLFEVTPEICQFRVGDEKVLKTYEQLQRVVTGNATIKKCVAVMTVPVRPNCLVESLTADFTAHPLSPPTVAGLPMEADGSRFFSEQALNGGFHDVEFQIAPPMAPKIVICLVSIRYSTAAVLVTAEKGRPRARPIDI